MKLVFLDMADFKELSIPSDTEATLHRPEKTTLPQNFL